MRTQETIWTCLSYLKADLALLTSFYGVENVLSVLRGI